MIPLHSISDLSRALDHSANEPVVLFKHSRLCGISAVVRRRVVQLAEDLDQRVYEIVVQDARPVSNQVEEVFGIRHESPQAFVIFNNDVTYHASHSKIKQAALQDALRKATA